MADFELELVRWLRHRIDDEERAMQRAAAAHATSTYSRKSGAVEALRAVEAHIDPLGGDRHNAAHTTQETT